MKKKHFFIAVGGLAYVFVVFYTFNHLSAWISILLAVVGLFFIFNAARKYLSVIAVVILLSSCERVAPNYYGVLMENFGKNGKQDYSKQSGRVNTMSPGTELFQVPAFEQRANFGEDVLHLKASDNTEFTAKPLYSYKVISDRVTDVVFQNARLGSGDDFMKQLEDNILEPHIYDLIKEESRKYVTDTLMASGGSLLFENRVQKLVKESFNNSGLELITFSANLDFSKKVKEKIDNRNEVNTNMSVLDQQIQEQIKKNELAKLRAEHDVIISRGLTEPILRQQFIEKWDGKTPLYGNLPVTLFKNTQ